MTVKCDHCGGDFDNYEVSFVHISIQDEYTLCDECWDKLKAWMEAGRKSE